MGIDFILLLSLCYLIIGAGVFVNLYEEDIPPKTKYVFMLNITRYFFWPFSFAIEITKSFYSYWTNLPDD